MSNILTTVLVLTTVPFYAGMVLTCFSGGSPKDFFKFFADVTTYTIDKIKNRK